MKRMWSRNELKNQADERVEALVTGGTLDNAKPIYCHPIYCSVMRDGTRLITFTCLVFNNDETPFTKDTFFDWCIALFTEYADASIMASGYSSLYPISRIKKDPVDPTTKISLEAAKTDGSDNDYWSLTKSQLASATFTDGVNKIN